MMPGERRTEIRTHRISNRLPPRTTGGSGISIREEGISIRERRISIREKPIELQEKGISIARSAIEIRCALLLIRASLSYFPRRELAALTMVKRQPPDFGPLLRSLLSYIDPFGSFA